MKRVKVFLGAYINQTNAQNLNCLELARNLDKSKFELYTLAIGHGNLGRLKPKDFHLFYCRFPVKLTAYLGFLWGIYHCNVAYLPRGNNYKYCRFLLSIFKRKSFKQIERVIDPDKPEEFSQILKDLTEIKANYLYTTETYAISRYIRDHSRLHFSFPVREKVLHVPVNVEAFEKITSIKESLKSVVLIGNELVRKGVFELFILAQKFKDITFHIIGRDDKGAVERHIRERQIKNIKAHGLLKPEEMVEVLKDVDLHLLLSKSEGFGKVTIECAAAGIPSIVYNTYGAEEWIDNGINGFIVANVQEVAEKMELLINRPEILNSLSANCINIPESYLPQNVVKSYEEVILNLYHNKSA